MYLARFICESMVNAVGFVLWGHLMYLQFTIVAVYSSPIRVDREQIWCPSHVL